MNPKALIALCCLALPLTSSPQVAFGRSIFLNGIDVSSARNQTLKNVQIKINENGDVFMIAPHYQVNEEETYTPLSRYVQGAGTSTGANTGMGTPAHVGPKTEVIPTVGTTPVTASINGITEPAGMISKGDTPTSTPSATGVSDETEKAGTKTAP